MIRSLLCLLLLAALPAQAQKRAPKELIAHYEARAQAFEQRDARRDVVSEIGTLRAWLGMARAYLKQEEEKDLQLSLQKIRAQSRLIHALLDRADAELAAKEGAAEAESREKEASALTEEAFGLEQKLRELEQNPEKKGG